MRAPPDAPAAPDEDAVVAAALRYAGKAPARDAQPTKRERQVAGEARALLRAFRANNFAVQDDLLGQVASGVFPAGAILNHACLPNAVVTYRVARQDGGRAPGAAARVVQEFRAVRRIAPGEEICHSYVDLAGFATAGERRDVLRERYGFACDCAACESGFPAREGHLEAGDARKVGIADQLMARAAAEEGLEAEVRLTEAALRAYRAALGPRHAKTVTALDARLSLALIAGDFGGAAALSRELAGVRQELYGGQPHPRAALDLLTLGEILRHVGERDEAREVLARAADMLAVTNGAEHHLTAGARAMLAS
ncbi:unnamed protein product [Pedinophyceae sp. YPF-701]|nr:unnamed protein product [Pedinophyceae sp. YPF-701]